MNGWMDLGSKGWMYYRLVNAWMDEQMGGWTNVLVDGKVGE